MTTKTFYTVQLSNFKFPNAFYSRIDDSFHTWDANHDFHNDMSNCFFEDKKKARECLRIEKELRPNFIYDLVEVTIDVKVTQ
jgi:hypothetical protein